MNDGLAECCNGNRLEEDLLDVQQCIGQAKSSSSPESSIGMIKDMAANAEQWMVEVDDFVKFSTA